MSGGIRTHAKRAAFIQGLEAVVVAAAAAVVEDITGAGHTVEVPARYRHPTMAVTNINPLQACSPVTSRPPWPLHEVCWVDLRTVVAGLRLAEVRMTSVRGELGTPVRIQVGSSAVELAWRGDRPE